MTENQEKPTTQNADLSRLPAALAPLIREQRWVVWNWELRRSKRGTAKWTKPPRCADDPRRSAKSNDPTTWSDFTAALSCVTAGEASGIGFMLLGSHIGAVDLDRCCADDGIVEWAKRLQAEADGAYVEVTVSGTGLRIVGKAQGPELHRRFAFDRNGGGVELYRNTPRYITVSGLQIGDCAELPLLDNFLNALFVWAQLY